MKVDGALSLLGGALVLEGDFFAGISGGGLVIEANATTSILGQTFSVGGGIAVYTDDNIGVAAVLTVSVGASGEFFGASTFTLDASFTLGINTSAVERTLNSVGLKKQSVIMSAEGKLTLLSLVGITGSFDFVFGAAGLEIKVDGTVALEPLGSFGVYGQLTADLNGLVGSLTLSVGDNLNLPGIVFEGEFLYAINTTVNDATVQVLDIDPQTGAILGQKDKTIGAYSLLMGFGGVMRIGDFALYGSAYMSVGMTQISGQIDASLEFLGWTLRVNESFTLDYADWIEVIELTIDSGEFLSDLGIDFSGSFRLEINTSEAVAEDFEYTTLNGDTVTRDVDLGIRLVFDGDLDIFGAIVAKGTFSASAIVDINNLPIGFAIQALANADILGSTFNIAGNLIVYTDGAFGVAGVLEVLGSVGVLSDLGIDSSGSSSIDINTNNFDRTITYSDLNNVEQTRIVQPGVRLLVVGSLHIAGLITLNGTFDANITPDGIINITVDATAEILGTILGVSGGLTVHTNDNFDTVGVLEVTASAGFLSEYGVTVSGSFLLEVNTGAVDRSFTYTDTNEVEQTHTVVSGVILLIDGSLDIAGAILVEGEFDILITRNRISIEVLGTTDIFGTTLTVSGSLVIYTDENDPGIAGVLRVSGSAGFLSDYDVSLTGTYLLEINTTKAEQRISYRDQEVPCRFVR